MARRATTKSSPQNQLTAVIDGVVELLLSKQTDGNLLTCVHRQLGEATGRDHSRMESATIVAQAVVHASWYWQHAAAPLRDAAAESDFFPPPETLLGCLLRHLPRTGLDRTRSEHLPRCPALAERLADSFPPTEGNRASPIEFDQWLGQNDRRQRAVFGVYYTPPVLASHIVRQVDRVLREEFGLAAGLGDVTPRRAFVRPSDRPAVKADDDSQPWLRILDPAAGTGQFLLAVIDHLHAAAQRRHEAQGTGAASARADWQEFVVSSLLPRLVGVELMLPAALVAWLGIAERLSVTGVRLDESTSIRIEVGDTFAGTLRDEPPFTVILGNPPFSALTTNGHPWIKQLLKARSLAGREVGSYYEVDGERLGERKLWLHDDYVQFLRYAQWQIERAGSGVVGLVTNHGYLDNVTFRGLRQSLLATFPRISICDLHGSRKKGTSTRQPADENVFEIEQGVAIGLFRTASSSDSRKVTYQELRGARVEKLAALRDGPTSTTHGFQPVSPYYFFVPQRLTRAQQDEYSTGFALKEIFEVHASAAVTARDGLVVAFTRDELLERLELLRSSSVTDDELRTRLLRSTRSRRYSPGDTRGWRLEQARESARAAGDLSSLIQPIQYRPLDRRYIAWADWLIDWPRTRAMRHLVAGDNLALVTRRQMLPGHPCNFFFVTDSIVIDGLLRSDNRGNESFFPLYVFDPPGESGRAERRANLTREFIDHCCRKWSWHWRGTGAGDLEHTIGPEDLLGLIYAQFSSHAYRERFAESLRLDFPRVFLPDDKTLAVQLCRHGRQLVELHARAELPDESNVGLTLGKSLVIRGGYPSHADDAVSLSPNDEIAGVSEDVWNYSVGAHQICRKWLRDRRGRSLTQRDLAEYQRIITVIQRTQQLVHQIDSAIAAAGGISVG